MQSISIGPAFPRAYITLDAKNRKVLAYHGARITWEGTGGNPNASKRQGTADPHFYEIPGTEPITSLEHLGDSPGEKHFIVFGLAGGEFKGVLTRS